MANTKWLEIGNTSILMVEHEIGCLKEWHPEAMVVLRQIYPTLEPSWHVWDLDDDLEDQFEAKIFSTKAEACAYGLDQADMT